MPYQFASSAVSNPLLGSMEGVHSIECILAITAALISLATLKSLLSSQLGYDALRRSHILLCSLAKSVCSIDIPTHQFLTKPVSSIPLLLNGSVPSALTFNLPSMWLRKRSTVSWSLP